MAKEKRRTTGVKGSKRKKKLGFNDSVRAVLVSSLLIGAAVFLTVALIIFFPPASEQADTLKNPVADTNTQNQSTAEPVKDSQTGGIEDSERTSRAPQDSPTTPSRTLKPAESKPISTAKPVSPKDLPLPNRTNGSAKTIAVSAPIERPPQPVPRKKGYLAIVLDDAGNNLRELEPFLQFPGPLTIAVLPGLPYSAEAAKRIRAAGKEVILHQPMEAIGGQNPGPGAIYSGMNKEEIERVLKTNLAQVGPVVGMNNHQGSKITSDDKIMEIVLAFCKRNSIYYLDSRTTAETVVPAVAERMGIRIGERDVFVDNIQEKAAMIRFMEEGLQKAEKKGAAIVIGHVWSNELVATLQEMYPELIAQGFSLTTVSRIMMGTFEDEGFGD
ncbi:divergent polysaccharide deacetylase family protein [Gracilinema caldarium]|uniref:divergent polysaccharide deacetylase family protein n=1 Tax=Gracilinema caldarium TaxID=215591 RepID=UPI0026EE2952|nr:divergent polysaccharide deacetylase family protein [Gracilinema caldarium]